jgi:hypothetical protein
MSETKVKPAGKASLTTTLPDASGPLFATVIVKVESLPDWIEAKSTVFVKATSAFFTSGDIAECWHWQVARSQVSFVASLSSLQSLSLVQAAWQSALQV